ncbi:MAG: acyl-CoA dehydrogenase family protein [Vicinamibacterales bacterium]
MNFDLTSDQSAVRDRARAFATGTLGPVAAEIDSTGAVPAALLQDAAGVLPADHGGRVVAIEEAAAVSASVAALMALGQPADDAGTWPGLRGVGDQAGALTPAGRAGLAAVAVGIGRAALDEALAVLKAAGDRPTGAADERPHWALADAATEVEASRLMVARAAQAVDAGGDAAAAAAAAQVYANGCAQRAVEAALRVVGPQGYHRGSLLERLSRDARALALVFGTEEEQRGVVADATLPK